MDLHSLSSFRTPLTKDSKNRHCEALKKPWQSPRQRLYYYPYRLMKNFFFHPYVIARLWKSRGNLRGSGLQFPTLRHSDPIALTGNGRIAKRYFTGKRKKRVSVWEKYGFNYIPYVIARLWKSRGNLRGSVLQFPTLRHSDPIALTGNGRIARYVIILISFYI